MSEEIVIDPPETFTATVVPLLREYQQKMSSIHTQLRDLKEAATKSLYGKETQRVVAAEFQAVKVFLDRFRPAARGLAQQVSGMIDQGRLTPLERAELQLRLAEFESALLELPRLLTAYQAT
ncbi:hypothetical protein GobsT_25010 [Gemmata obscuriglobus]|uniref:Uncharacterized protein n=1 Tax=Gemmata obscuriglobus TaxID=114 RepID=A0A2Z3H6J8_9BACT|nr:hypothetical protein [Gemmata obscuriglobus]AWM39206.1 hypothetical protein C1280_20950 [Gemmata obscuriglobus]QEG27741.1 hypothetical protein GobsT_25010 [Gemmata obscuriglobus]VTS05008.1 unnamed protein product [Gemmata obscuriglobus UQM 2246]